jgi:hypothetical protein
MKVIIIKRVRIIIPSQVDHSGVCDKIFCLLKKET